MGKHNLGIFYFKKALQENDNACAQLGTGSSDPGKTCKRWKQMVEKRWENEENKSFH